MTFAVTSAPGMRPGLIDEHLHLRLFPVGYWLWPGGEKPPQSRLRLPGRRADT